ncbi:MAG: hypothetical protein COT92_00610 [Candidatus Doudnabacteria bacterium CG10_big_fil_rev_8_21_14_0_10_42_18]|uniref:Uncharacterized protein n=1 Tax=Candidatus Doudnabacteria bacterium CG10_big_fil_rev_8_21_14_0_10_42_18 TaxID=1974552 RepID=A0A2H0VBM2_9BACT|nr:MAG: hypothetical protein COT92_00610 [Candidatus Doudnabacteria bacterium CG10_big_fil_rev_8_21_14_0_10_42_18]
MTIKRFFVILVIQWLAFSALKYYFFDRIFFGNLAVQYLVFWILVIVLATIFARKLGVINYFEAIFIAVVWTVMALVSDLMVLTNILDYNIYSLWQFWVGYLLLPLAVFFFHRKRHVELRKLHKHH